MFGETNGQSCFLGTEVVFVLNPRSGFISSDHNHKQLLNGNSSFLSS